METKLMKKNLRIILACACLLMGITAGSFLNHNIHTNYAAAMLSLSNNAPKAGEDITVSIKGDSSKGNLTLLYSKSLLSFKSCSANHTNADGSITFEGNTANIVFNCTTAGKFELILKDSKGTAVASAAPTISGEETKAEETPAPTTAEPQFTIDGTGYVASDKFADAEIPSGFEPTKVNMFSHDYKCLSNGTFTLVYLKPASDITANGNFFYLDTASKKPYAITTTGDKTKYFMVPNIQVDLPNASMTQKQVSISGVEIPGYVLALKSGTRTFAYGCDQTKVSGWFEINETDGSYSATDADTISSIKDTTGTENNSSGNDSKKVEPNKTTTKSTSVIDKIKALFSNSDFLFVVTLAAIIIVLTLLIRNSKIGKELMESEDDADSDLKNRSEDEDAYDDFESENTESDTDGSAYEDSSDEEDVDEEIHLGFFAKRRKEKEDEEEWRRLSEMDLDDYSSEIKDKMDKNKNSSSNSEKKSSKNELKKEYMTDNDVNEDNKEADNEKDDIPLTVEHITGIDVTGKKDSQDNLQNAVTTENVTKKTETIASDTDDDNSLKKEADNSKDSKKATKDFDFIDFNNL